MAKVIFHGTHYNAYYPNEVACRHCEGIFRPHWRIIKRDKMPLSASVYIYVECPYCTQKINLDLPYEEWVNPNDINTGDFPDYQEILPSPKYMTITCHNCDCFFLYPKDCPPKKCPECYVNIKFPNQK